MITSLKRHITIDGSLFTEPFDYHLVREGKNHGRLEVSYSSKSEIRVFINKLYNQSPSEVHEFQILILNEGNEEKYLRCLIRTLKDIGSNTPTCVFNVAEISESH